MHRCKPKPLSNAIINSRVNVWSRHNAVVAIFWRQSPQYSLHGDLQDKNLHSNNSDAIVFWKDLIFVFNQPLLPHDILVVYDYPPLNLGNVTIQPISQKEKNRLVKQAADQLKLMPMSHLAKFKFRIKTILRPIIGAMRQLDTLSDVIIQHPKNLKIHVATEPVGMNIYTDSFIQQFGMILGSVKPRNYQGKFIPSHGGLDWWYGFSTAEHQSQNRQVNLDYNALLRHPKKTKHVSIITSRQKRTLQQRYRVKFITQLEKKLKKSLLNFQLDIFGNKRIYLNDKADGLAPYRYHIAMENTIFPHYWTEKLADALLAECFVFYAGAPNIYDYFDRGSIELIDISNPEKAIDTIQSGINRNVYDYAKKSILENKRRLMEEENFFNIIWRAIKKSNIYGKN